MVRNFLSLAQSGTKTFKDRVYGISLEYPKGWKKKDGVKEAVVLLVAPKNSFGEMFAANINVTVQDLSGEEKSLDEYVQDMIQRQAQFIPEYKLVETGDAVLAGFPAASISFSGRQGYVGIRFLQVCTIKDKRAYAVTSAAEENRFSEFLPVARNIMESFKINS